MTRHLTRVLAALAAAGVLGPAAASAQSSAPAAAPMLRVQEMTNGFLVAPDVRLASINDRSSTLAGAYAGWLTDDTLFIGAAGYWNTNRDRAHELQYGGAMVRWNIGGDRPVALSTGTLVGLGTTTLERTYGQLFDLPPGTPIGLAGRGERLVPGGRGLTTDTRFAVNDTFFIAEPQLTARIRLTPWLRVDTGVGYRLIGGSPLLGDQLRGVSGSVALQIGGR